MILRRWYIFVVALTALFFLAPATALADDLTDEEVAAEYYEEASQAYESGEFDRAADLLGRAFERDPNPVYRYNEILALQGAGNYERALALVDEFEEDLHQVSSKEDITEIRAELNEAIDARDAERRAAEKANEPDEPAGIEPPPASDDAEGSNLLAWSLIGSGGAALGAGLFFGSGLLIADDVDRLEQSADGDDIYTDSEFSYDDDRSTLRTHRILSGALLAGGFVAAATGTTMLILGGGSDTDTGVSSLRIEPTFGADGAGALLGGRF